MRIQRRILRTQLRASAVYQAIADAGGRKRFTYKFKFSVEFPIGLHVILQLQINKNHNYVLS